MRLHVSLIEGFRLGKGRPDESSFRLLFPHSGLPTANYLLTLRFINAVPYSFRETEHFHRGLRPYGAPSRPSPSQTSAEPRQGAAAPPLTPSACALSIPDT